MSKNTRLRKKQVPVNEKFVPFANERDEMGRLFLNTKARLKRLTNKIPNSRNRPKLAQKAIFRDKLGQFSKYDYGSYNFPVVRNYD